MKSNVLEETRAEAPAAEDPPRGTDCFTTTVLRGDVEDADSAMVDQQWKQNNRNQGFLASQSLLGRTAPTISFLFARTFFLRCCSDTTN